MPRLYDVILWVHWAWLVLMVLSPWLLPWYVICLMSGAVLAMNAWNDLHCPITQWEFNLRRKALDKATHHIGAFRQEDYAVVPGDVIQNRNGDKFYVHEVDHPGRFTFVTVTPYLPMRSAIERGLEVLGITLSSQAQTALTLLVLLGAPLLAWWRTLA